jgi:phosphomannomutase
MMKFDWGWFGVRASNTEPVLRLNVEALTKENLDKKISELKEIIYN